MQDLCFYLNPKVNVRSKCQIFVVGQDSERSRRIDPIAGVCRGRSGNVMCANIPEHPCLCHGQLQINCLILIQGI